MFRKSVACLCLISLILCMSLTSYASENNRYGSFSSKQELEDYLAINRVDQKDIQNLIDKAEKGIPWDSGNEQELAKVPESFFVFDPLDGSEVRYFRFNDGSFIKIETIQNEAIDLDGSIETRTFLESKFADKEVVEELIESIGKSKQEVDDSADNGTRGVDHGTGYAWYYDHKVSYSNGICYAHMYTEFVIVQSQPDYITPSGFYGAHVSGFGELGQFPTFDFIRTKEDVEAGRWALANLHWYTNHPISTPWGGISGSATYYLWLGVGSNKYRVSPTLPY